MQGLIGRSGRRLPPFDPPRVVSRFASAEDVERYIGMLPGVRSQNFRCFCTDWIFDHRLIECSRCGHRMHVKCGEIWFQQRRTCPYCSVADDGGNVLEIKANGPVTLRYCQPGKPSQGTPSRLTSTGPPPTGPRAHVGRAHA